MKLLTTEQQKSYENAKLYYICKEKFENKYSIRHHWHYTAEYRGAAHSICNLKYKFPIAFHNGPNFIILS